MVVDKDPETRDSGQDCNVFGEVQPISNEERVASAPEATTTTPMATAAFTSDNALHGEGCDDNDMAPTPRNEATLSASFCDTITSRWKTASGYLRDSICHGILILTRHAALNPISYIVGTIFISFLLLGIGLATNFEMNVNARQMITPFSSLTREQNDWIQNESGFSRMPHSLRIMVHNQGENVVTREGVFKTFEIVQTVQDAVGYKEFCQQSKETNTAGHGGLCHIRGVPLFWNLSFAIATESIQYDSDVKLAVSQPKLPDNSTVDPREFMGHIKYYNGSLFDTIESAESFLMELRLPYHGEGSWELAKKLLDILLRLRHTWHREQGTTYRLEVYLTDHSLESESIRAVFQDVPLIACVFVVMSLFTCLVFTFSHKPVGSDRYRQRFLLGFGAVATVLLSMITAYGILFIVGVPMTSITQILPFVMFGIGLDDSFIIFGEFVRTDHKKGFEARVYDTFDEIGLTAFLTSVTTTVAFGLGALTSLPQLYWLAMYAFPCSIVTWIYNVTFFVAVLIIDERRLARRLANQPGGSLFSRLGTQKQEYLTPSVDEPAKIERKYETAPVNLSTDIDDGLAYPIEQQYTSTDVSSENGVHNSGKIQPQASVESLESPGKMALQDQSHYHHHQLHAPKSTVDRFMNWYSDKLLTKPVKIFVLISFVAVTGLLAWSASMFTQEFNIYEVLTDDSYVAGYFHGLEKYAERGFVVPHAYFRNVDQSDPEIRDQMEDFVDQLVKIDSITSDPPFFWLKHFNDFLTYDERLPDLTFNMQLEIFLSIDTFRLLYGDHIVRDPETGDILSSRVVMYMDNLDMSSLSNQIQAWRDQLNVTASQPINDKRNLVGGYGFNFFLHEETMIYVWEFYARFVSELTSATILGLVAVSVIAFVFLPHWSAVCFISPLMAVLSIDMIGFIQMCGVHLNAISHFTLIMSIGLLIDFQQHILLTYYESPCTTRDAKVKDALQTMGFSVFVGGFSTFLGVVPLIFSQSDLMKALFFGFWGMVVLGLGHGLIVLPVILSYVGPLNTNAKPVVMEMSRESSEDESIEEEGPNISKSSGSGCHSVPTSDTSTRIHLDSDGDLSSLQKSKSPLGPSELPVIYPSGCPSLGLSKLDE